jgi:hypothetical protein
MKDELIFLGSICASDYDQPLRARSGRKGFLRPWSLSANSLIFMSRSLLHILLMFALVFSQQMGSVHLSSHAAQELAQAQQKKTQNVVKVCEQCALFAALGSSPPNTYQQLFAVAPVGPQVITTSVYSFESRSFGFYHSRAPPILL